MRVSGTGNTPYTLTGLFVSWRGIISVYDPYTNLLGAVNDLIVAAVVPS